MSTSYLIARLLYTKFDKISTQLNSQVRRELGVGYGTLRRPLEMEIGEEELGFIIVEEEIFLVIDEHNINHQKLVYTITDVKKRRLLGVLIDDNIASLR